MNSGCSIKITGWKELRYVALLKIFRSYGYGLAKSKELTDAVLKGGVVCLSFDDVDMARAYLAEINETGCFCDFIK